MKNLFTKKYKILYIDPPWPYTKYSNTKIDVGDKKRRITPYTPLTIRQIKSLPIDEIAEKDSVLLMWTTGPHNEIATEIIKEYGFEYKTWAFTWRKRNKNNIHWHMGYGHYTRSNTEICLLATRGKGLKVLRHDIEQNYDSDILPHSEKPDEFRKRTVQMFGDLERIELFARIKPYGWDALGYELDGKDIRYSLLDIDSCMKQEVTLEAFTN